MHKVSFRWPHFLLIAAALMLGACRGGQAPAAPPEGDAEAPVEAPEMEGDEPAGDDMPESESRVPADTFVLVTIGEPETLDPAWTYETSGAGIEANLYDSLVYFDREQADAFVPSLATDWQVSDDGTTYTFDIREGVTFHEGGTLEPSDIAYSLQRAMLQDRTDGPMWLFLEPFLGSSSVSSLALDLAGIEDEEATLDDVPDDVKAQVCESVKDAVQADNDAGTVTLSVLQPTPWLLQLLAQPWSAALDQEWMAEQGAWDGDCATWTNWNDPSAEESVIFDAANGTGPYMLGTWKKGEEITLEGNQDYWRTEPIWDGGPSGPPAITHVVIQQADEWGARFAKLSAGEADSVVVPRAEISQVEPMLAMTFEGGDDSAPMTEGNPDGTLKLYKGYPSVAMTAAMFNFDINADSEFIGSGTLDGAGIPPDFFSDINVRRAFSYCFDWETFIQEALQGEGFQARGPIIEGLPGHEGAEEIYTFDLDQCEAALAEAWDGQVAENGFAMTLAYNEGNDTRKMAAQILAENLSLVSEDYQVEVQSLEWPSFLDARRGERLPISVSGWLEDYHDSSNWVHPFMHSAGAYGRAQGFPEEMQADFDAMIDAAVVSTDEAERAELYGELQAMAIENAISIFLHQATGRFYVSKDVQGWFDHPLRPGLWYYALSKDGG